MDWSSLLALLTSPQILAFLAPLIAAGVGKIVTGLPAWAKPVLSVLVGIIGTALGGTNGVMTGVGAGLAGIGIAEFYGHGKTQAVKMGLVKGKK